MYFYIRVQCPMDIALLYRSTCTFWQGSTAGEKQRTCFTYPFRNCSQESYCLNTGSEYTVVGVRDTCMYFMVKSYNTSHATKLLSSFSNTRYIFVFSTSIDIQMNNTVMTVQCTWAGSNRYCIVYALRVLWLERLEYG